jgi:hypothetical protein
MVVWRKTSRDMESDLSVINIFSGEESKRHHLHFRFILPDNRRRFGKIQAIAWNIKVLNRLRCARMRGIGISSYGTAPCV